MTEQRWRLACWALHLYTASGALFGILALEAAARGEALRAFQWMLVTIVIDGTDGTLARRMRVRERLPQIDGGRLDDVVDYFTYVIVPVLAMVELGMVVDHALLWGVPILASAFGFANVSAKTEDDYFLGFPSYWNLVAIYLYFLGWPSWLNTLCLLALAALVFCPIRFVYPSRTKPLRPWTIALGLVWTVQMMGLVLAPGFLPSWWFPACFLFPAYYLALSLMLNRRTARGASPDEGRDS